MLTETTSHDSAHESLNLASMAIADKVGRHVHARYYGAQLGALQDAARRIGVAFVPQPHADHLSWRVEEHLAFALSLARAAYSRFTRRPSGASRTAKPGLCFATSLPPSKHLVCEPRSALKASTEKRCERSGWYGKR